MRNSRIVLHLAASLWLGASLQACGYNTLSTLDESVEQNWSEVENQLQRRADLIPNLVESVKGYAQHEKEVFSEVSQARAAMLGASSRPEKIEAATKMENALSRLIAISENYPQLKADQTFTRLMDELAGTENRLAVARKRYNDAVAEYNTTARKIPTRWSASIFGFDKAKDYFKVDEAAKQAPKVDFESG
jgi:LemA protein